MTPETAERAPRRRRRTRAAPETPDARCAVETRARTQVLGALDLRLRQKGLRVSDFAGADEGAALPAWVERTGGKRAATPDLAAFRAAVAELGVFAPADELAALDRLVDTADGTGRVSLGKLSACLKRARVRNRISGRDALSRLATLEREGPPPADPLGPEPKPLSPRDFQNLRTFAARICL